MYERYSIKCVSDTELTLLIRFWLIVVSLVLCLRHIVFYCDSSS
jgi:hypothetical protein